MFKRLALLALLAFACDGSAAVAAPPPAGSVQTLKVILCDGAMVGTTNLSTVTVTGFPSYSTRAWVQSVGDWFDLQPPGITPSVPLVQVVASDGRHWVREFILNPEWLAQATWSMDESNVTGLASDENTGIDDTHPLLSVDELVRRIGVSGNFGTKVIRWLSNTTHSQINLASISPAGIPLATPDNFPVIIFVGVPTVLRTGTLTGATDAPWTVTDSSLPTSWTASGLISSSSGTRLIRKTDKTKHAFMAYESTARTAKTSPTNGFTEDLVWFPFGTPAASFAPGDTYEVLSLPKFPRVTPPDYSAAYGAAVFMLLDMDGILGGQVEVRNCGFDRPFPDVNAAARSGLHQIHGGLFAQGAVLSATYADSGFDRVLFLGRVTFSTFNGDMNGDVNVIANTGRIFIAHAALPRLGAIYVYDTTFSPVIQITNNSTVSIDSLQGSGNTGVLVDVRDSGCSVNSRSSPGAFNATTSAAHPISVVGTQYDYTAIPITVPTKNASFTTN